MPKGKEIGSFLSFVSKEMSDAARNGDLATLERCIVTRSSKARSYRIAAWRWLSNHNSNFIDDCRHAIFSAAAAGKIDCLNRLLEVPEMQKYINVWANGAVYYAAMTGQTITLNRLLENPAVRRKAHEGNNSALRIAIENGHGEVVTRLLQMPMVRATAYVNANEALMVALHYQRLNIIGTPERAIYDDIVNQLRAIPEVRAREGRAVNGEINTHTTSIHVTSSQSAMHLKSAYAINDFTTQMSRIDNYFKYEDKTKKSGNMFELRTLIAGEVNIKATLLPNDDSIKLSIIKAINYIQNSSFIDPVSKISLHSLFKLILVGINRITDAETKKYAYLQLLTKIYASQNEYGLDSKSCDPGFFNNLIYSQQTTLPEAKILIHTKETAANALQNNMRNYAINILKDSDVDNMEQFEQKIKSQAAAGGGLEIMLQVIEECYGVFGYTSAADAKMATSDELEKHCKNLYGCTPDQLFEFAPIDLTMIYREERARKGNYSVLAPKIM